MTAALLVVPGAVAGLCLILFATPWLERLTGFSEPLSTAFSMEPAPRPAPPAVVHIGIPERNPPCTSA